MSEQVGWIVEARLRDGQREAFRGVMEDLVAETEREGGTLVYEYYVSDDGDVMVLERFRDVVSAELHIGTWDRHAERWIACAEPTRMVHLGDLPESVRSRHEALEPLHLKTFGGFARAFA